MKNLIIVLILLIAYDLPAQDDFNWPDGKKAAVCLTYDDAIDCHLDLVVPALDEFGIKGTFFLTGSAPSLANRTDEWRAAAESGHELGNHTLFHPCIKVIPGERNFEWLRPEYDLDSYTFPQLMDELRTANSLLGALDGRGNTRTFAYSCVDHKIRGIDFSDSIQDYFVAARAGGIVPKNMKTINPYLMPSTSANNQTGEQLIAQIKLAQKNGTIATLFFHSVGGGYLNTTAEAHRELLQYLSDNSDEIWVDTFLNVTEYINSERQKLE